MLRFLVIIRFKNIVLLLHSVFLFFIGMGKSTLIDRFIDETLTWNCKFLICNSVFLCLHNGAEKAAKALRALVGAQCGAGESPTHRKVRWR